MDNLISIGAGVIIIVTLILANNYEGFVNIDNMPLNKNSPDSGLSIFLNFYPNFGPDLRLFEYVQKLKLNNSNLMWNGLTTSQNARNLNNSKKLPPVILVPGLGATALFARWNKSESSGLSSLSASESFQKEDSWACRKTQGSWVQIWPPESDGLQSYCWADNVKVKVSDSKDYFTNAPGVNTTTREFGSLDFTDNYMDSLIEALLAVGYVEGENLFGAGYDFRKIGSLDEINNWCMNLTLMIEKSCSLQENPAVIIGHDLGSVIANYFLVSSNQAWKDNYIKSFITVSGAFGGCPKALRAVLSGVSAKKGGLNFTSAVRNFSGLHLMLPNPVVYGDNPLVHFNQITYNSYDIPNLLNQVSPEAVEVSKITEKVRDVSMKAPGVTTHILAGNNLNTESSYKYSMSLVNDPQKNYPFYQLELPENQKFNYPDYFVGDGTMPKFALEYPIFWTRNQTEPVYFQFFGEAEHTKILSKYEPIKYILGVISS